MKAGAGIQSLADMLDRFQKTTGMDWERVREVAMMFEPSIRAKWPEYLEEMKGQPSCHENCDGDGEC